MCYPFFSRYWGFPFGHMFFGPGFLFGLFWLIGNFVLAFIAAGMAKNKKRNEVLWFFLTLVFGFPVLLAAYLMSPRYEQPPYERK